ncbi:MAG: polysaccharide biosynthesis/export family protein [Pseudomonadota bacterium]
MFPRLMIVGVVSLATLTGCKHRDSYTEFHGPSAITSSVHGQTAAPASSSPSALSRLGDAIFGPRSETTAVADIDGTVVDDDGIRYVEPTAQPYKTDEYVTQGGVDEAYAPQPRRRLFQRDYAFEEPHAVDPLPAYKLDTGDRVRILVFEQPEITRVYNVDGQGRISVPLLGSVLARGRTTRALKGVIKRGLERKVLKDAQVAVEIAVYRPFFIHGEVRSPGRFPYVYGLTMEAAIATAGGFSPRAAKNGIRVVRTIEGTRHTMAAAPGEYVRPGDVIMVDERFF